MELGDLEEGNPGCAPGESLPSTPLKDGEQPKNKAKPKRTNKRHRQGNGGNMNNAKNMGHLTVTTTSPAMKKPCFSEADFPPLGNNAKNSQRIATENKENVPQPTRTEVKCIEGPTQAKLAKTTGRAGNPAKIVVIKGSLPSSSSASTTPTTTATPSKSQSAKSTKTPFQLLAESVAVMQVAVNDKVSAVQQSVNEGINVVKKLITDPTAGVEPRVTKLEAQVPVIEGLKRQIEGREIWLDYQGCGGRRFSLQTFFTGPQGLLSPGGTGPGH